MVVIFIPARATDHNDRGEAAHGARRHRRGPRLGLLENIQPVPDQSVVTRLTIVDHLYPHPVTIAAIGVKYIEQANGSGWTIAHTTAR